MNRLRPGEDEGQDQTMGSSRGSHVCYEVTPLTTSCLLINKKHMMIRVDLDRSVYILSVKFCNDFLIFLFTKSLSNEKLRTKLGI